MQLQFQASRRILAIALLTSIGSPLVQAQDVPLVEIPFESIPDGIEVQGSGGIALQSNVHVSQNLAAEGTIAAGNAFIFPDGSVQTTSASALEGNTANSGLYVNRIADFTPTQPFTEICFKGGQVEGDVHATSESTAGGNCVPGDIGFVIERNQRGAAHWEDGRLNCLLEGMRLPEPFEWKVSCDRASGLSINNMLGDWEWTSNSTVPLIYQTYTGVAANANGNVNCDSGQWGWVAASHNLASNFSYRCVR